MSANLTTQSPQREGAARGSLVQILQIIGPVLLAAFAGYGAVRYSEGTTTQRIQTLETTTKTQAEEIQKTNERALTREEFKTFTESVREDLREIKADVRAIRSDLNHK